MWSVVLLFVSWFVSAPRVYSWIAEPPLTAAMMLRRFYIAVGGMTQSTLFLFSSTLKITPPGAAAEYSAPGSSRYMCTM